MLKIVLRKAGFDVAGAHKLQDNETEASLLVNIIIAEPDIS